MKVVSTLLGALLVIGGAAVGGRAVARGEDSEAEARIRARLRADRDLRRDEISVRVKNGVATLWGRVDSQSEQSRAEELARVEGVTRVDDLLEGGRTHGSLQTISDASVSLKLRTQYANDRTLKGVHIAVTTTDGVVTLSGSVPSERARRRVLESARNTAGVKTVRDKLEVVSAR
jgi:hyperosmotically inducible periplasmic protein